MVHILIFSLMTLQKLVQKSLEKNPPKVMPRLNLLNVPKKNRKQIRSLSKHLYRIKLDQRHALHDPRFEKSVEIHSSWGTFEWLVEDAFKWLRRKKYIRIVVKE